MAPNSCFHFLRHYECQAAGFQRYFVAGAKLVVQSLTGKRICLSVALCCFTAFPYDSHFVSPLSKVYPYIPCYCFLLFHLSAPYYKIRAGSAYRS